MRTQQRRVVILQQLAQHEHVSTSALSDLLGVTSVTVRSDLEGLEQRGRLRRVHGGAVSTAARVETSHDLRGTVDAADKQAIAAHAVALIEPGSSIILDVGTTTLAIAEHLVADDRLTDVTVVTNGVLIASRLEAALPRIEVYLTGGSLRAMQHSLVNPGVTVALDRFQVNLAFIGCDGIDARHGVTTTNMPEAEVKEAMRRATERSVLVAASSKLDTVSMVKINDVAAFDTLVTDHHLDERHNNDLEALGLEIVHASPIAPRWSGAVGKTPHLHLAQQP